MTAVLDDLEETKRIVAEMERDYQQALGALAQLKEQLKEFRCRDLKEARIKRDELHKKAVRLSKKYTTEYQRFLRENEKVLDKYRSKKN